MDLQTIIYSKYGIGFTYWLGRILPPPAGRAVANGIAWFITSRKRNMQVRAVRANQWIVSHKTMEGRKLENQVHEVFEHSAQCLYEMFHYYRDPAALMKKVRLSPRIFDVVERCLETKKGIVLVGPHLSNFDLAIQAALHCFSQSGLKGLALSPPQPPSSYQRQNQLRNHDGLDVVPFSVTALRRAAECLSSGGIVITGVDRPITSQKYPVRFFGESATLPVTHVQLALNANVPVVIITCHMEPDGSYCVEASEEIPMQPDPDHQIELTRNAEAILSRVEASICEYSNQWLMFFPVWSQALDQMP